MEEKQNLGVASKEKIHTKLNEEYAVQEVAKLTREGKSIAEIVEILNIAPATVSKYRKRANLEGILDIKQKNNKIKRKTQTKLNKEYAISEVAKLAKLGKTISDISKIMDIAESTVAKFRKYAVLKGILNKSNKGSRKLQQQNIVHSIINLIKEGKTDKEISVLAGVSVTTVWKYRKKLINGDK